MKLEVGSKVKFAEEKQRYTVQASNERFAVCTKPFNCRKTTLYTIIDFQEQVRGPENLVFGMGTETREQCKEMLTRLIEEHGTEISYRHRIPLRITAAASAAPSASPRD